MNFSENCSPPNLLSTALHVRPMAAFLLTSLGALALASSLDRPVWLVLLHVDPAVLSSDWSLALRSLGYLPVWLAVALAFYLIDRATDSPSANRAALLVTSVGAAGGVSEILKLLIRRLRPSATGGEYAWRSFLDEPFSTSGLAMPSGHAVIAFAAAWILCRLYPAAAGLWIAAACGCAATRVISQAHFVSDTVLSAAVAFAVVRCIWGSGLFFSRSSGEVPASVLESG